MRVTGSVVVAFVIVIASLLAATQPATAQLTDVTGDGSHVTGRTVRKVVEYGGTGQLVACYLTISSTHSDGSTYHVTWRAAQNSQPGDNTVLNCRWTTLMTCSDFQHFLNEDGTVEGWECPTAPYGECVRVSDFLDNGFGLPAFRRVERLNYFQCLPQG